MNKGSVFKNVEVVDYSYQGLGVVKIDNFTIFVPFVKTGDQIDIQITELKKNFGYGVALNYSRPEVKCPYFYQCGSCNMMHMPYGEQIGLKQKTLLNLMHKNMIYTNLEYFCSTDQRTNYRNKIALPTHTLDGQIKLGYYKRGSHAIIPISSCLLADQSLNQLVGPIETALNKMGESTYNYKAARGNLRHVILRGDEQNIMVTVITTSGRLKNEQLLIDMLSEFSAVKSIVINTQKSKSRVIMGKKNRTIYGPDSLQMELNGLNFKVKPNAFFQVNKEMTENIFAHIKSLAEFENKNVLDAFCGTGTIGLSLAASANSVIGIEIDSSAVSSANLNKKLLEIENAEFICDDIENAITKIDLSEIDIALVDPPRSGLATNMKQALVKMKLDEIIYVSCDPSTLMRDIGELAVYYEVESIKGFDMFPNTNHIETVAHLKLRKGN